MAHTVYNIKDRKRILPHYYNALMLLCQFLQTFSYIRPLFLPKVWGRLLMTKAFGIFAVGESKRQCRSTNRLSVLLLLSASIRYLMLSDRLPRSFGSPVIGIRRVPDQSDEVPRGIYPTHFLFVDLPPLPYPREQCLFQSEIYEFSLNGKIFDLPSGNNICL